MAHNPFTPPGATVTDVELAPPPPRPWSLKLALTLMWISQASPLAGYLFDPASLHLPAGLIRTELMILGVIMLILAALIVALILCVGRGQRWARIVYSALVIMNLINSFRGLSNFFHFTMSFRVVYLVNGVADIATVLLLFIPATNRWFNAVRLAAR